MIIEPNDTVHFLVRLRRIDVRSLTVRDALLLYAIISKPGISGIELTNTLGLPNRSNIQSNVIRLQRGGYIEDRRVESRRAHAAMFHVTPAGLALWDEIKP